MKTWIGVLLVIATIIAPPLAAKALKPADDTTNDITITLVTPQPGNVVVSGSVDVATGYAISSITVDVRPAGDAAGEGGENIANIGSGGSFFSIVVAPGGTYDIQATLVVVDGNGNPSYFFSDAMTNVTIPPGP